MDYPHQRYQREFEREQERAMKCSRKHPSGYISDHYRDEKDGSSEIYVMDNYIDTNRPPTRNTVNTVNTVNSEVSTKNSRGVMIETMSAPNPCCPNTKGVCCLLLLVNLGLILLTLGFSIVLQLTQPPFLWFFGIAFLIVGMLAMITSLIFCVHLCRESERNSNANDDIYWTHHWQKRINLPTTHHHDSESVISSRI